MEQKHTFRFSWILLVGIVALTGCQRDKDNLNTYINEIQSRPTSDIPPIPVMRPYERFSYAAAGLRDPFIPTVIEPPPMEEVVDETINNGIAPDDNRRREALEFFSLRDLQFVGTLEQDNVWALIRSPDSVIHKVQIGNYMGGNHGQILAINDTALKLKEIVPEGNGYIEQETSLSVVEIY